MLLTVTVSLTLNANTITEEASPITINPNPIDLGLRPSGAWMEPMLIEFGTTGEEYTIVAIKSSHPFFIINDLCCGPISITTENTHKAELTHGEADNDGEITGDIVVRYLTQGNTSDTLESTFEVKATAYIPATNDVWETAEEITLPFTATATSENLYNNYSLLDEDLQSTDAVYKVTLSQESIISANVEGENSEIAIYQEGFDGYGGPRYNNFFKAEIAQDQNAEVIFSYNFNDGQPTGWSVFEEDNDGNQWNLTDPANTTTSGTDGSIAIYSNTYSDGPLYPDNYIITTEKYTISENTVLSWDAKSADLSNLYNKEHYAVVISDDKTEWDIVWEETINYTEFNHIMVSLDKYAGQEVYIGFRHYDCNGDNATGLIIDNILLANTNINGIGIQNAILPAGTYYFVVSTTGEYTVNIETTSIDNNDENVSEFENKFNIYPNPTTSAICIKSNINAKANIMDIVGHCVKEVEFSGNTTIDIKDLSSGIYFISIQDDGKQYIKKIVIK